LNFWGNVAYPEGQQLKEGLGAMERDQMSYETPAVIDYGTLVQLTAAQAQGQFTDRDFPAHTPQNELTFSD
jgi:hypothetical protein